MSTVYVEALAPGYMWRAARSTTDEIGRDACEVARDHLLATLSPPLADAFAIWCAARLGRHRRSTKVYAWRDQNWKRLYQRGNFCDLRGDRGITTAVEPHCYFEFDKRRDKLKEVQRLDGEGRPMWIAKNVGIGPMWVRAEYEQKCLELGVFLDDALARCVPTIAELRVP